MWALVAAVAIWGIATSVIKDVVGYVPPYTFLFIRFLMAGVITIPAFIYYLIYVKIDRKRVFKIAVASTLGYVITLALIFLGLESIQATDASLISSLTPLLITVLAFAILHEKIKGHQLEGLLIAFLGTLLIIFSPLILQASDSPEGSKVVFVGNLIFFLGVLADAFYNIYVKKFIAPDKVITPTRLVLMGYIIALILFFPLMLIEQYSMYKIAIGNPVTGKVCTIAEYDADVYRDDLECDSNGCFNPANKEVYICATKVIKPQFSTYIKNNFSDYTNLGLLMKIGFMAYISGILAYILFAYGLKTIDASKASVFYYLQPLFGIPFAMMFLNEKINIMFIIGAAIILGGVVWAEKNQFKK